MMIPPFLQSGDLVRVVATSGALKEFDAFDRGVEIWRSRGYSVEFGQNFDRRHGYLAGTDAERRQGLRDAWLDPDCKAILCARGGYGSARLLEDWTWPEIDRPKWIIGFSDVTGILWSLARQGITGVHGAVLTTVAEESARSLDRLFSLVEGGEIEPLTGEGWGGGKVSGRLLPANLTVATHLLGTPVQPELDGVILALEDVTEAPYRIDRMLTQWRASGVFQKVKGIALGRFSRCEPPIGSDSQTVEEVLKDRLGDLQLPIVSGLSFGHDGENLALPVGTPAELDGNEGRLEIFPLK
ncbi:LD-carboxypeptidase [Pannus brasiliensis CCIBt3594]|uniref:LD-carboxypeptidase n=1 Tax=Pannus brasiliensis CCIBt3594 TaxID=1427578 RepID=A0AAW9QR47_9CHRO